jgi:hypothetical protein
MGTCDEKIAKPLRVDERVLCCPHCGSDRLSLILQSNTIIAARCDGLDCNDDTALQDLIAAPRCAGCNGSVMLSLSVPGRVSPQWVGACAECNMVGVLCGVDDDLPEIVDFND